MPTFNSFSGLNKYIQDNIKYALQDDVARKVKSIIDEFALQNQINAYNPTDYQRTYEFFKSLTIGDVEKIDGGYSIEIYYDSQKIGSYITNSGWNQHADIYGNASWNGKSIPEWIPYWIEYGTNGSLWDREPANIISSSMMIIQQQKEHLKRLIGYLKTKGFVIK
jgi:hypothetical protein